MTETACHLNQLPCTVDSTSEAEALLVQTVWSSDGEIVISILYPSNSNDGYVGRLLRANLESTANILEIPFDQIHSETTAALSTNGGIYNFLYHLNTECAEFIWRKQQTASQKIIYGRVELVFVPLLKDALLQRAIDVNIANRNSFSDVLLQYENLKREHAEMTAAFEDCVAQKTTMETVLLGKFIVLLNGKKDKIAELQEELERMKERLRHTEAIRPSNVSVQQIGGPTATTDEDSDVDDHGIVVQSPSPRATLRMLSDSSQSQELAPPIVLPKRSKIDSPVTRGMDIVGDHVADVAGTSAMDTVTETMPAKPVSQSVFDRDTDELIDDL